ncbi:MAG: hypothetical protein V5804_02850 [Mucilaginibacter sp.]|uniref:hypothetical protein n=1 Tax=Mucilaginibacter sp. TaxID=1882438 RepID=UPI0034E4EBF2
MEKFEQLFNNVKEQAQIYLLDSGEFFPFGVAIDTANNIKPLSSYLNEGNDRPSSLDLIDLLETYIQKELVNDAYIIAAICIDVNIKQNEELFNALEIRIFEKNSTYKKHVKYFLKATNIEFID